MLATGATNYSRVDLKGSKVMGILQRPQAMGTFDSEKRTNSEGGV